MPVTSQLDEEQIFIVFCEYLPIGTSRVSPKSCCLTCQQSFSTSLVILQMFCPNTNLQICPEILLQANIHQQLSVAQKQSAARRDLQCFLNRSRINKLLGHTHSEICMQIQEQQTFPMLVFSYNKKRKSKSEASCVCLKKGPTCCASGQFSMT